MNNFSNLQKTTIPPIIIALDFESLESAKQLADQLNPKLCRLKIGKEMFTKYGPKAVEVFQNKGFEIFLDLKFHDIPNTVAKAIKAACGLGVWMVNVHAMGGKAMLEAAKEAIISSSHQPILLGVTVLTSMQDKDLKQINVTCSTEEEVLVLATLCKDSGLDGVVCSALEANILRRNFGQDFMLVTPGIRLLEQNLDDQKRIVTPKQALQSGSSFLVIGRPVTQAKEPTKIIEGVIEEIS